MGNIFNYTKWKRRRIAIIHMPFSTDEVHAAYSMLDIPHILYQGEDPDLEEKFIADAGSICGISIGGGTLKPGEYSPALPDRILNFNSPKLGICLGHEILGQHLGARIITCNEGIGEQGEVIANLFPNLLFEGLPDLPGKYPVRMYHTKMLETLPIGSELIAETRITPIAGFYHPELKIWGLQFHPEKDWMNTLLFKNYYNYCLSQV